MLRRATPELTSLLRGIERFSGSANATVDATRTQLLALLSEVEPVLAELSGNSGRFNRMLRAIVSAGDTARNAVPGDYLNIAMSLHLTGIVGEGPLGGLLELLDVIGVILPADAVNDLLAQLGLDPILGNLHGRQGGSPSAVRPAEDPLGLGGLLSGHDQEGE